MLAHLVHDLAVELLVPVGHAARAGTASPGSRRGRRRGSRARPRSAGRRAAAASSHWNGPKPAAWRRPGHGVHASRSSTFIRSRPCGVAWRRGRAATSMKAGTSSPKPTTDGPRSSSRRRSRSRSRPLGPHRGRARSRSRRGRLRPAASGARLPALVAAGVGSATSRRGGVPRPGASASARRGLGGSAVGFGSRLAGFGALVLAAPRASASRGSGAAAAAAAAVALGPLDHIQPGDVRCAGSAWPVSFSIASTASRSSGVASVKARPSRPARPVRPMRWT